MKRLWSVFTNDMDHCYFTGIAPVERHHIFFQKHFHELNQRRNDQNENNGLQVSNV